jgi:hypothetical protein
VSTLDLGKKVENALYEFESSLTSEVAVILTYSELLSIRKQIKVDEYAKELIVEDKRKCVVLSNRIKSAVKPVSETYIDPNDGATLKNKLKEELASTEEGILLLRNRYNNSANCMRMDRHGSELLLLQRVMLPVAEFISELYRIEDLKKVVKDYQGQHPSSMFLKN